MKTKICSVGECMIEIANTKNNIFQQSFAGDTLNFCNYIDKKYFDVVTVSFGIRNFSNINNFPF